jgi:hypothetical protein
MNKRTPFYLKGMSFKDSQTPIKQTKGSLFKPIEGGLFKPNLFSNKISDDFKERTAEEDKAYIEQEASKYKSETKPFVDKDPGGAVDKTQQPASNTRGINPELAMAATMPLNYLIGKGLTALVNRKSKKKQQAEELDKQEKKVTETESKQINTEQKDALTTTENPTTADEVVDEGGNVGQFA